MRRYANLLALLLAGCASALVTSSVDELTGHYRGNLAIDSWDELNLASDETCVWWYCSAFGGLNKIAVPGRWMIEGGEVVITPDPGPNDFDLGVIRLTLRRLDGEIYLVPAADLEWFEANGPHPEFCLQRRAALLHGPPYGESVIKPLQVMSSSGERR